MPSLTIENNVALTGSVARLCAIHGARMIYASSSEVYQPHNIYGWTKLWGEQIARYYLHSDVTCARISMPYGPGHPPGEGRAALTNFLWLALLGRPLRVHRGAMRSWCWIGDTCRALVKLLDEPPRVTTINIGRDDDLRPISAVAQLAVELTNSSSKILEFDLPPGFTPVKNLPCGKLRSLGWTPEIELRTGMEITRDWLASLEVCHGQLA
jgi:nucleoside-diphosphate-sugar epimerase